MPYPIFHLESLWRGEQQVAVIVNIIILIINLECCCAVGYGEIALRCLGDSYAEISYRREYGRYGYIFGAHLKRKIAFGVIGVVVKAETFCVGGGHRNCAVGIRNVNAFQDVSFVGCYGEGYFFVWLGGLHTTNDIAVLNTAHIYCMRLYFDEIDCQVEIPIKIIT